MTSDNKNESKKLAYIVEKLKSHIIRIITHDDPFYFGLTVCSHCDLVLVRVISKFE